MRPIRRETPIPTARPRHVPLEPRPPGSAGQSPSDIVLGLQRAAGNQAVSGLLSSGPAVQRHTGIEPEIAAAHVVSSSEQAELPAVADTPTLLTEQAELLAERKPLAGKVKAAKDAPDRAAQTLAMLRERAHTCTVAERTPKVEPAWRPRVPSAVPSKRVSISGGFQPP